MATKKCPPWIFVTLLFGRNWELNGFWKERTGKEYIGGTS